MKIILILMAVLLAGFYAVVGYKSAREDAWRKQLVPMSKEFDGSMRFHTKEVYAIEMGNNYVKFYTDPQGTLKKEVERRDEVGK